MSVPSSSPKWAATSGQFPGIAVGDVQPLRLAGAVSELVLARIPLQFFAVVVGQIDQMANRHGARANLHVTDRPAALLDGGKPITLVVGAFVELDLRVREIFLFRHIKIFSQIAFAGGIGFGAFLLVADPKLELAAVDNDLSFTAEEGDAWSFLWVDFKAFGVFVTHAPLGIGFIGRKNFHRPALIHAHAPLRDIEMVRAPIGDHAPAVLTIIAPAREMLVHTARTEL